MKHDRRRFLSLTAGSMAVIGVNAIAAGNNLSGTPSQTAGPFYPIKLPLDKDNDLVQIVDHDDQAKGIIANVYGYILDRDGQPVVDAEVEIWQCDANGRYHHPDDPNDAPMDENFQGYGSTRTDMQGRYRFRTIKPVPYPGRTPHIHYRITSPAGDQLTTQLYIKGFAGNRQDGLFNRLGSKARQQAVSVEFEENTDDSAQLMARWDVVLG